jgi:hypothetical protein
MAKQLLALGESFYLNSEISYHDIEIVRSKLEDIK